MNKLVIKSPYIKKVGTGVRLCADIEFLEEDIRTMYFEVEDKWGEYLCAEVSDAFLVGLLNYALCKGYDIECETPVSDRLLYQVKTYIIPTLGSGLRKGCKIINVKAPVAADNISNMGAVGTSASGGVDSFYSIVRHLGDDVPERYRMTHLLIANQFNLYKDESDTRDKFKRLLEEAKPISDNYGLELIGIYTNHHEFMFDGFVQEYSFRICSYALALQKLFRTYYVSSGGAFSEFRWNDHVSAGVDIFNLPLVSTDILTFYSSGGERMRSDKIEYFADDSFIQKKLHVCNMDDKINCSVCEKCMRTMTSLDIMGKLAEYGQSFDISKYHKGKNKFYGKIIAEEYKSGNDLRQFAKKHGFKYPFRSYIYAVVLRTPFLFIKNILSNIKVIKKLYYKLRIDELRFGKQKAEMYRFGCEEFNNKGN